MSESSSSDGCESGAIGDPTLGEPGVGEDGPPWNVAMTPSLSRPRCFPEAVWRPSWCICRRFANGVFWWIGKEGWEKVLCDSTRVMRGLEERLPFSCDSVLPLLRARDLPAQFGECQEL